MSWLLTVPEHVGMWGTNGQHFRPGVHVVDDPRVAEAARRAGRGIVCEASGAVANGDGAVETVDAERADPDAFGISAARADVPAAAVVQDDSSPPDEFMYDTASDEFVCLLCPEDERRGFANRGNVFRHINARHR